MHECCISFQGCYNNPSQSRWFKITETHPLTMLETRSPESSCCQGWVLLGVSEGVSAPSLTLRFWWWLSMLGVSGVTVAAFQSLLLMPCDRHPSVFAWQFPPLCGACPCASSYKSTSHTGLSPPTPTPAPVGPHRNLHLEIPHFHIRSPSQVPGVRTATYLLRGKGHSLIHNK